MFSKWRFKLFVVFLGLWLLLDLSSRLGTEIFWFQEVGYLQVFLLRVLFRGALWVIVAGVTAVYLLGNLFLAQRWRYPGFGKTQLVKRQEMRLSSDLKSFLSPDYSRITEPRQPETQSLKPLEWRWLLPLGLGLSLLVGLILAYYGEIAFSYWYGGVKQANLPIPPLLRPERLWLLSKQIISQGWYFSLILGGAIAILIYPQFLIRAGAVVLSVLFGLVLSQHWAKLLQYFHPTSFSYSEPLFNQDISIYVFALPMWELLEFWLIGLFLYGFIAVTLTYLLSAQSLSQGIFPGFSTQQQRHLFGMGGFLMLAVVWNYWLSRYQLLYSTRGVSYGASYTDVIAQLPAYTILCVLAVAIAFYLFWRTIFWRPKSQHRQWVFYGLGVYLLLAGAADVVLPKAVQYLIVQPNELQREQPYIQRTITLTRQAFDLEVVDAKTFNPQGQLTEASIKANDLTIRNIRLWDQRPLLETNRQLQQIRPYYRFPNADIDRYTLEKTAPAPSQSAIADTEQRQVLIAARELDYGSVPQEAQTWVNRHLIYTHGYGFTISPVNTVGAGGVPEYFVKNISGGDSALTTSSPAIRNSIPIGKPRIYYGEITNNYVMTGTRVKELDYPSGSDNVYNSYDGRGGIGIGATWKKWLFATYLKDWQMLLTQDFLPETKVLLRRNVKERIQAIAPFLKYDSDPYLVVADANADDPNNDFPASNNYLYWIVDAYTTSDRYPYADPASDGINYIRNSVKVVIDAYHGTVNFYTADANDPIIATWQSIFPKLFKPLSAMPASLRSHIRYPVDFFKIQSERLMTYHMTDTQVFYNREDQWQIPNEIYDNEARPVEPYYLITSLPSTLYGHIWQRRISLAFALHTQTAD